MSNFGKAQLLKYGWSEGKGLGKDENGIAEALKPKLKFDTAGIGHKDSDFQWWSSVYDKALKNVLDNNSEKVSINIIKENAFNISSSQSGQEASAKKLSLHYGKFLKTSTLKDGTLIKDKTCAVIEDDKEEEVSFTQISDEELFRACGGRTAHKGARHGLKLSGKLARIAEQEKKLLEFSKSHEIPTDLSKKSKKAKKRKMGMDVEDCILQTTVEDISGNEDVVIPPIPNETLNERKLSKKSARKLKRKVNDLSQQFSKSSLESTEECTNEIEPNEQLSDKPTKKSVKKLQRKLYKLSDQLSKSCLIEETTTEDHCSNADESDKQSQTVKKKSKKKRHKRKLEESNICSDVDNIQVDNDITEPCLKKSKKQYKGPSKSEGIKEKIETDADMENVNVVLDNNSKYSYSTWKNAKIKSKKLKKYEKKKKNKSDSNSST